MAGRRGLYRIFLMNRCNQDVNRRWNDSAFNEICGIVERLFNQVVAVPECPYTIAQCFPGSIGTNLDPGELLLYFVPSKGSSIIKANGGGNVTLEAGGATWDSGNGMISEIYVDESLPAGNYKSLFANLVFHELMHNKLDAANGTTVLNDLHTQGGAGLAWSQVGWNTALTFANRSLMARNLARSIPQFTGALPRNIFSISGNPVMIDGQVVRSPDSGPKVDVSEAESRAAA